MFLGNREYLFALFHRTENAVDNYAAATAQQHIGQQVHDLVGLFQLNGTEVAVLIDALD